MPQIREALALLLHRSLACDKPARIRRNMTRRLKRNELARLYYWKSHKRLPPKRVTRDE